MFNINIKDIDHFTLMANDLDRTMRFYHEVFDLPIIEFKEDLLKLRLGNQILVFEQLHKRYNPSIYNPTAGAVSFSVITKDSLKYMQEHLANYGVKIIKGPIEIKSTNGKMNAIYVYDPDHNLIEIIEPKKS